MKFNSNSINQRIDFFWDKLDFDYREIIDFDTFKKKVLLNKKKLVSCNACRKKISILADDCPSCGEPNDSVLLIETINKIIKSSEQFRKSLVSCIACNEKYLKFKEECPECGAPNEPEEKEDIIIEKVQKKEPKIKNSNNDKFISKKPLLKILFSSLIIIVMTILYFFTDLSFLKNKKNVKSEIKTENLGKLISNEYITLPEKDIFENGYWGRRCIYENKTIEIKSENFTKDPPKCPN